MSFEPAIKWSGSKRTDLLTKIKESDSGRIRKITPREAWRLMGFSDTQFDKVGHINSSTQLYK